LSTVVLIALSCCLVSACADDPVDQPAQAPVPGATDAAGTDLLGGAAPATGATGTDALGMAAHAADGLANGTVHRVQCGCAIESVGKCSEWIEVDGEYVPLAGDLGLGSMPFCRKEGLRARVSGAMKDGKFVATAIE